MASDEGWDEIQELLNDGFSVDGSPINEKFITDEMERLESQLSHIDKHPAARKARDAGTAYEYLFARVPMTYM